MAVPVNAIGGYKLQIAVAVLLGQVPAPSAGHDDKMDMTALHRPDLNWQDGPPSLPLGAKIAVLEDDPTKPGPFVFRVKVPDGYRVPPHPSQAGACDDQFGDVQPRHGG